MRVSVLRGTKDLVVEERPEPVPGPREVLVRVTSEPTADTRPADSWPRISGEFTTNGPIRPCS